MIKMFYRPAIIFFFIIFTILFSLLLWEFSRCWSRYLLRILGWFGIGGGVSMLIGSILLPQEPVMVADQCWAFCTIVLGTILVVVGLGFLIATILLCFRKQGDPGGSFFQPAQTAKVVSELSPWGMVKMRGELWKAYSQEGGLIPEGVEVEIIRQDGLTLIVRKKANNK